MIDDPIKACRFYLHDESAAQFTDAQVQEFLDMERVPDRYGKHPEDVGWTPTYNVLRAAGRGWLWLAGKADSRVAIYRAGDVSVHYDGRFCTNRARELMGSSSVVAPRADEPWASRRLERRDGPDPRHREE